MVTRREGLGGWVKKVKGLRSTYWWLQNSHRDVKYSTRNIVNNIVITMYEPGGYWKYWGDHFIKYVIV